MNQSAVFLRTSFALWDSQWALTEIYFGDAWLTGIGLERSIGDIGWNTDLAYMRAPLGERSYARLTSGISYQFSKSLFWTADYHFNGAGGQDAGEYLGVAASFAARRGGVFLAGRHYLISGLSYPAHPLVSVRGQVIAALQDPSVLLTPALEWNIFNNSFIDFGAFLPLGAGALRSEFGSYPAIVYSAFRYYF